MAKPNYALLNTAALFSIIDSLFGCVKIKHKIDYNHRNKIVLEQKEVLDRNTGKVHVLRTVREFRYV